MTIRREMFRNVTFALAASFLGSLGTLLGQTAAAPSGISSKILMREPLGDTTEPGMSLSILTLPAGRGVPSHSHTGVVFAYILQGELENQIETEPVKVFHCGDFFHERPKQLHRVFRSRSQTEPVKILVFQNTGARPSRNQPLIHEPLTDMTNQEVSTISLVAAPGVALSGAHQHPGPVFAYVVKGEVESQADPGPAKVYHAGEAFYEPPLRVHRLFRNPSKTEPADLVLFEVSGKGSPLTISVDK